VRSRRDIGAQHLTVLADCLGERNRKSAGATADLEHPLAGGNPRPDQQQIIDRLHPPLDKAFKPDPARAGDRVPIFPLRRIGCRARGESSELRSCDEASNNGGARPPDCRNFSARVGLTV
jgi:hypothetical protein